jgi:hypothetical protein
LHVCVSIVYIHAHVNSFSPTMSLDKFLKSQNTTSSKLIFPFKYLSSYELVSLF